jgi:hypothetical protein
MNAETALQHRIMLALSEAGCIMWRNNTGQAWNGRLLLQQPGSVTLANALPIKYGLCVGSSDLIGIHRATGRFVAVEIKTPKGRASTEQQRFINAVLTAGGIAGIVRSPAEALALLPGGTNAT